ncbi:hypothetical protein [Chloroflexus sp.]|uniref:hypothetical protein n=1 Tax=Chloroflexus sp. TaxID=1904827 RepID=UPI002ACEF3C1|nr:hypothetical protein [Chloroflexus sp.]
MTQQQDRSVIEAQATLRKALERQWRAWNALIIELEAEVQAAERAKDPEAALFDAPPTPKANLPLATRKQLLAVFDARLQTAQAEAETEARQASLPPPDAEEVRHKLIAHIARELHGEIHEKGLALIYWNGKLVPFDHRALQRTTSAADYLGAGLGRRAGSPLQTGLIVGGGVILILSLLFFMINVVLAPSGPRQAASVTDARVGDLTVTRWDVQAAGGIAGVALRVDSKRVSYPLVICAPERQMEALVGQTVTITGTASVRQYIIAAGGADLQVVSCENPQRELARGTLAGAFTALPAAEGRVRDVWVRGPANDPQRIPSDRMEVAVLVAPDTGEASLVLADGTRLSPSERRSLTTGLELVYLAPLSQVTQSAGLHEQVPGSLPRISTLLLPAPEDRLSYLARVLTITDTQVEREGSTLRLTLTVRAKTDRGEPLTLQSSDIRAAAGSKAVDVVWAPLIIEGDNTPQQLVIEIPTDRGAIMVAVGTWQASILP